MANEWAGGNSSWQLWIGMFSGSGVNVVKWVSQNNGHSEARTSFQPSNQKEKPTLTYKVSLSFLIVRTLTMGEKYKCNVYTFDQAQLY